MDFLKCCKKHNIKPFTEESNFQYKKMKKIYKLKANIRNLVPIREKDIDFIINNTTDKEKIEIILLYDECVRVLLTNMESVLDKNIQNNIILKKNSSISETPPISIPSSEYINL